MKIFLKACYVLYKWTYVKHMLLEYRCENKVESKTACKSETCNSEGIPAPC